MANFLERKKKKTSHLPKR